MVEKEITKEFIRSNDNDSGKNIQDGSQKSSEVPDRLRNKLYARIEIPIKTMDIIIGSLVILLVALLAWGILM